MSLLYAELDQLAPEHLVERFFAPPPEAEGLGTIYFEELASRIAERQPFGVELLEEAFDSLDEPRARAVIVALTLRPTTSLKFRQRLSQLLGDQRPFVVMEAIRALAHQRSREVRHEVASHRLDPSPYVRGAVLRYLRLVDDPSVCLPLLLAALSDEHYIVRESAADELGELHAIEALPQLKNLLIDPERDVRTAAETAIRTIEARLHRK